MSRPRPLLLLLPSVLSASLGTMFALHPAAALGAARVPFVALLWFNLFVLSLSAWPSLLGFAVWLRQRPLSAPAPIGRSRTAILVPVHNEDPRPVFVAASVMLEDIAASDLANIDLHVLSDTRDPAIAAAELGAAEAAQAAGLKLHYRRRAENTGCKAGNIAEFCARCADAYEYMIVLDADSLMTADTMRQLIGLMDADTTLGAVQTVPYAVNRETLFARWLQFGARLHTPLWALGSALWAGDAGNYWGHNAILRIRPFVRHCRLPVLAGKPPLGGEILCHDVVEAGLLRRDGWRVIMAPALGGSWEELPTNMLDFAGRERRWCQGNLQHGRLLGMAGLPATNRAHLAIGILYYVCGLSWAAMVALPLLAPNRLAAIARPVTIAVLILVLLPKLVAVAVALHEPGAAWRWGGRGRLLVSALIEQVLCVISAPITLLFYARFVPVILAGHTVRWDAQPRSDRGLGWAEGWGRLRMHLLIGVAAIVAVVVLGGAAALGWALPAVAGLLLAVPFVVLGSRDTLGRAAARLGLFGTEDEIAPHPVLRAYRNRLAEPSPPASA